MIVIGLTGSIGSGKSTVAEIFKQHGAAIFDADKCVHKLLEKGGEAVGKVEKIFPETKGKNGEINREKLGKTVFYNQERLHQLEAVLHPLVRKERDQFIKMSRKMGIGFVLIDVPLLIEQKIHNICDEVIVVSAPTFIRRQRVLKRKRMTEDKFQAIDALQMPTQQKKKYADFIINTGLGKAAVVLQVKKIIRTLQEKYART